MDLGGSTLRNKSNRQPNKKTLKTGDSRAIKTSSKGTENQELDCFQSYVKIDCSKIACPHLIKGTVLKTKPTTTTDEIFCNCRRIVTSEDTKWPIKQLGVHLVFPLDALSEPTPIMVQRWKNSVCSPPLEEHEAITSNVIELSPMDSQGLKFNTKVKLSLSHSATNLMGYELVIKQLTDKETNKWEDLDGTKDIRSLEGIKTSLYTVEQRVADYQFIFCMKTF